MSTQIEGTLTQGVLHLVFASEGALNMMDDPWFDAFAEHLQDAAQDKAVRVVLLSARGKVFCAGANLQRGRVTGRGIATGPGVAPTSSRHLRRCRSRAPRGCCARPSGVA